MMQFIGEKKIESDLHSREGQMEFSPQMMPCCNEIMIKLPQRGGVCVQGPLFHINTTLTHCILF